MTIIKEPVLEADLLNGVVVLASLSQKVILTQELKNRYLNVVDPFWHSENDTLDYIVFYNNGEYFCQKKKLKYDFKEKVNYWATYPFYEATVEQAEEFRKQLESLFYVSREITVNKVYESVEKIDKEALFFDQKYAKKVMEKNRMLAASDWRVLPDIQDSYPGEKDMWVKWRQVMRSEVIKMPEDFESNLDFFKYLYNIKYPIDPSLYIEKYPEKDVEYLSTDDQWVNNDIEASVDFVDSRMMNILSMSGQYREVARRVRREVMDLMKLLEVNQISNVDFDKYVIEAN